MSLEDRKPNRRLPDLLLLAAGIALPQPPQNPGNANPGNSNPYLNGTLPSILTREELGHHVWGDNVHVDLHHTCRLDQSLNSCIRHSTGMLWITGDPARDGLHADRRYQALIHSVAQSLAS